MRIVRGGAGLRNFRTRFPRYEESDGRFLLALLLAIYFTMFRSIEYISAPFSCLMVFMDVFFQLLVFMVFILQLVLFFYLYALFDCIIFILVRNIILDLKLQLAVGGELTFR